MRVLELDELCSIGLADTKLACVQSLVEAARSLELLHQLFHALSGYSRNQLQAPEQAYWFFKI